LVAKHHQPWELYDISVDRCERNNLASKEIEKLTEMIELYRSYEQRALVAPWPLQ
jgi:hypothetical protein